jgi:hypothetical protein
MARLRLCAVVLAALLLAAAHAERIEDASEEDDAGLGYIVTLNDDDADAEDLCAALAADTDDFTGGAASRWTSPPSSRCSGGTSRWRARAVFRASAGACSDEARSVSTAWSSTRSPAAGYARSRGACPTPSSSPTCPSPRRPSTPGNRVPWNLDRLDQAFLPLDGIAGLYTAANGGGDGVHAYVIDSGVRATHREFTVQSSDPNDIKYGWDKTSRVERGVDLVVGSNSRPDLSLANRDCDGHGTHIAATLAGTHVGVAPLATVHPARVLDCRGDGRASDVVAALDWCVSFYFRTGNSTDDDDMFCLTLTGALGTSCITESRKGAATARTRRPTRQSRPSRSGSWRARGPSRWNARWRSSRGERSAGGGESIFIFHIWLFLVIFGVIFGYIW